MKTPMVLTMQAKHGRNYRASEPFMRHAITFGCTWACGDVFWRRRKRSLAFVTRAAFVRDELDIPACPQCKAIVARGSCDEYVKREERARV